MITLTKFRRSSFIVLTILSVELFVGLVHRVCQAGKIKKMSKLVNVFKKLKLDKNQKRFASGLRPDKSNMLKNNSLCNDEEDILSFSESLKILQKYEKKIESRLSEKWQHELQRFALQLKKSDGKNFDALAVELLLRLIRQGMLSREDILQASNFITKDSQDKDS